MMIARTELLSIGVKKMTRSGLSYHVRNPDEMVQWMEKIAECLAEDHNLSIHQSRTLLTHYEYNIEKLTDNLKYEFDKTFKSAGLSMDDVEMEVDDSSDTVTCDGKFSLFRTLSQTHTHTNLTQFVGMIFEVVIWIV